MKKEEKSKIIELVTSSLFIYAIWTTFGIYLILVMEGLLWVHKELVFIPDFGAIFTMLLSDFMVLVLFSLVYFSSITIRLVFLNNKVKKNGK